MGVIKPGEPRNHADEMAAHWPRSIQDQFGRQERRRLMLQGKLMAESLRIGSRRQQPNQGFAKRKSYVVPPRGDARPIRTLD